MIDLAKRNQLAAWIIGAVLLFALPFVVQMAGNAWVRIIDIALLYVLLALGLNIVVGYAGLLDLGYVGFYATGAYTTGVLTSHGSNGSQAWPVEPHWDWVAFHTNGAPEEQRKIGHNAWEIWAGPTITNETSRYPEVGMWAGQPLERQKMLAYDSGAGAALLCAGYCFHSVNGKQSVLWDGNEQEIAREMARGALSVPLQYQDGDYTASHLEGIPLNPDELRRYARKFGSDMHWVSIHA
jgi:hypothetical protein